MVAVTTGRASPVGELYNEAPDRVSDIATLAGLGYAAGGDPVLGWGAACAAVLTAYVRALGKAAGAPQDYGGPMAKPHRMFLVTVTALWCGLAPGAWQPATGPGAATLALAVIALGSAVTCARRLARTASFLKSSGSAP
jgi:phosphatidylglycerophosphate synthase